MIGITPKTLAIAVAAVLGLGQAASPAGKKGLDSWPMWGGSPDRNMVSDATGLPTTWDVKTGKNVKWVADLGSQSYGNPTIGGGVVLVGTNNEAVRDPKQPGDRGVLMAFDEATGAFLWQGTYEKLSSGRANDWPFQGIASSPLIIGDVAYFMTNRAVLMAVDIRGFTDNENDGPFKEEKLTGKQDPDVIWQLDTMEAVGNFPHNLANSSPVAHNNLIYISTGNGQDESHVNIPSPKAPSIVAVDIKTGEPVWEDASPGERILHGQWSTPAVGTIGGVLQVVHGQGDGWVRGYEAVSGKKLWEFDTNPKASTWPKTRNEIIATPVIVGDVVYLANGQDPEHGEGVGNMYAIDATKRGDISPTLMKGGKEAPNPNSGRIWHYTDIRRTISTASVKDGIVYNPDFSGFLHAIDAKTGKQIWKYDMFAAMWSSAMVADGKVYLGDEDGDVVVLKHGAGIKKDPKAAAATAEELATNVMDSSVYSTVITSKGVMFIMTRNKLYAIQEGAQLKK